MDANTTISSRKGVILQRLSGYVGSIIALVVSPSFIVLLVMLLRGNQIALPVAVFGIIVALAVLVVVVVGLVRAIGDDYVWMRCSPKSEKKILLGFVLSACRAYDEAVVEGSGAQIVRIIPVNNTDARAFALSPGARRYVMAASIGGNCSSERFWYPMIGRNGSAYIQLNIFQTGAWSMRITVSSVGKASRSVDVSLLVLMREKEVAVR